MGLILQGTPESTVTAPRQLVNMHVDCRVFPQFSKDRHSTAIVGLSSQEIETFGAFRFNACQALECRILILHGSWWPVFLGIRNQFVRSSLESPRPWRSGNFALAKIGSVYRRSGDGFLSSSSNSAAIPSSGQAGLLQAETFRNSFLRLGVGTPCVFFSLEMGIFREKRSCNLLVSVHSSFRELATVKDIFATCGVAKVNGFMRYTIVHTIKILWTIHCCSNGESQFVGLWSLRFFERTTV